MRRFIAQLLPLLAALIASASLAALPPSGEERTFAVEAHARNRGEIDLAKLAEERTASPIVRDYADRIISDHTEMDRSLEKLAASRKIELSAALPPEALAARDELAPLRGAAFDRAYMRRALQEHRATMSKFEEQARNARDGEIRDYAHDASARLREHLALAQRFDPTLSPAEPSAVRTMPGAGR